MVEIVSDARIAAMIAEGKPLPLNWRWELAITKPRPDRNVSEVNLTGTGGSAFRIVVRQQTGDDFSVILLVILDKPVVPNRSEFPLLRYDGASHNHRNKLEGNTIRRKPHIHRATERYQKATNQRRPDGYAEETARYRNLPQAWDCFRVDTDLRFPSSSPPTTALPQPFTGK